MFKRNTTPAAQPAPTVQSVERITSVLGPGVVWQGNITGSGGVRVEGTFEGQIALKGLLPMDRSSTVVVAGAVRGNITTQKLEIRASGRVWGDVVTTSFVTEDGAFLRGQIRMEDEVKLDLDEGAPLAAPPTPEDSPAN